jgi:two-component system, NarL family, sensor histidine kinase UhpB
LFAGVGQVVTGSRQKVRRAGDARRKRKGGASGNPAGVCEVVSLDRAHGLPLAEAAPGAPRADGEPGASAEVAATGTTLKLRLSLIITALLALLTGTGAVYVVMKARNDVRDEARSTLTLTGHFLDAQLDVLRDHWSEHGYAVPMFQLRELRDIRHVDVRFYDSGGRLIDSNEDASARKPEAPGWFTSLVKMTSAPGGSQARTVSFNGTPVGTLVIAPDPTYEIEEMWSTSRGLLGLLLLFFVLVNVLVWWAVSRALQPIERILQGLGELRAGNLSARLPKFELPEMSRIGVGFNHMAQALEKSVSENQRLTRQLLTAQESERRNLAHDLHDEIGQCVSAIHADAVAIRNRGGDSVRESADAIVEVTGHIKECVRSMLRRLRPAYLEGLGLEAGLREQIGGFRQRNPAVACALKIEGNPSSIDGESGVAIYRVVQEALTNIAGHARARNALVELVLDPPDGARTAPPAASARQVRLVITDDGGGFLQGAASGGLGLTGIRERVNGLGGSCHVDSEPGRGTRITVCLPLSDSGDTAA